MVHAVDMMAFPRELFDYIINSLDAETHRSTLLSCSLVSQSWVHAARRSLFKVFIVARRGHPNFIDLKNFLRSENPGFCVYVKTLVLRSGTGSWRRGRLDRATFWDIIEAFPEMESIWLQDIELAEHSTPFSFSPRSQHMRLTGAEPQPMQEGPRNRPSIDSLIISNACICERMFEQPPYIVLSNFLEIFSSINYLSVDGLEWRTEPLDVDSSSSSPEYARTFLENHDISFPDEIHWQINQLSVKSWDNSLLMIFKHILRSPPEDLLTLEYLERGSEGEVGQNTQVIWRDLIRDLGARLYVLRICLYGNQGMERIPSSMRNLMIHDFHSSCSGSLDVFKSPYSHLFHLSRGFLY